MKCSFQTSAKLSFAESKASLGSNESLYDQFDESQMEQEIEDSTLGPQLDVRRRKMEKHGAFSSYHNVQQRLFGILITLGLATRTSLGP